MDISKEYILMCEKAEEIQISKNPHVGDFWCNKDSHNIKAYGGQIREDSLESTYDETIGIWLPRQDQLQEMVLKLYEGCHRLTWAFAVWTRVICLDSLEQLWLAFVMKEKYNKVWDGEKWITQEVKG